MVITGKDATIVAIWSSNGPGQLTFTSNIVNLEWTTVGSGLPNAAMLSIDGVAWGELFASTGETISFSDGKVIITYSPLNIWSFAILGW